MVVVKENLPFVWGDIENCKMAAASGWFSPQFAFCSFQFSICIVLDFKAFMGWPSQSVSLGLTSSQTPARQGCLPAQDLHNRREPGQRSFPSLKVPGSSPRDSAALGWWVSHGKYWD